MHPTLVLHWNASEMFHFQTLTVSQGELWSHIATNRGKSTNYFDRSSFDLRQLTNLVFCTQAARSLEVNSVVNAGPKRGHSVVPMRIALNLNPFSKLSS